MTSWITQASIEGLPRVFRRLLCVVTSLFWLTDANVFSVIHSNLASSNSTTHPRRLSTSRRLNKCPESMSSRQNLKKLNQCEQALLRALDTVTVAWFLEAVRHKYQQVPFTSGFSLSHMAVPTATHFAANGVIEARISDRRRRGGREVINTL